MDYKDYLINHSPIELSYIAGKMWPENKAAKSYLSKKLSGERPWTEKDNALAKKVINELGDELSKL